MASKLPPGELRRRTHRLVLFGLTSATALVLIGASGVFLAQSVTAVAMTGRAPRTERRDWYVPANHRQALTATDFDIARSVAVKSLVPDMSGVEQSSAFTHTVGAESLRVGSGPLKNSIQHFALKGGTRVLVGRSEGGWVEIIDGDGRTGWVHSSMLKPAR